MHWSVDSCTYRSVDSYTYRSVDSYTDRSVDSCTYWSVDSYTYRVILVSVQLGNATTILMPLSQKVWNSAIP